MRTQGSLRLILNTKLWPQMQVDKASEKSVRITAMDTEDQGVKVFLISVCIAIHYTRAGHKNNVCVCVCWCYCNYSEEDEYCNRFKYSESICKLSISTINNPVEFAGSCQSQVAVLSYNSLINFGGCKDTEARNWNSGLI